MLVFDGPKPPLCKLCGREKGRHKAETMGCPVGRGSFPWFRSDQFYEPRATRKTPPTDRRRRE